MDRGFLKKGVVLGVLGVVICFFVCGHFLVFLVLFFVIFLFRVECGGRGRGGGEVMC